LGCEAHNNNLDFEVKWWYTNVWGIYASGWFYKAMYLQGIECKLKGSKVLTCAIFVRILTKQILTCSFFVPMLIRFERRLRRHWD
jgi:hypothetical protein